MTVVRIRHMRMRMLQWLVLMRVAVRPGGHGFVRVLVVPVVVTVRVLMLQRLMRMRVGM